MNALHSILNFLSYIFFGAVILIILVTVTSNNQFFGKNQSFLVKSGSMEPTIMTGDVIVIQSQPQYNTNDVVTFKEGDGRIVTHRIIDTQTKDKTEVFITKGDANRSIDNNTVTGENIIGKVTLVIPKIGFLVGFTQTMPGLIVMIFIPVILLVMDQLVKMYMKQK